MSIGLGRSAEATRIVPQGLGFMTETSSGRAGSEVVGGSPVSTLIGTFKGRICRSPELGPSVDRKFRHALIQLSAPRPR